MITDAEYRTALKMCKDYQLQVNEEVELLLQNRHFSAVWLEKNPDMSQRLKNILRDNANSHFFTLNIDRRDFLKIRNAGEGTWNEFTKLRGY